MKSKILFIALLFCGFAFGQSPFYNGGTIGTVQTDGTVQWSVTEAQINTYLTDVMNNQQGYTGTITTSTIVYISSLGYWTLYGIGADGTNSRIIRVELSKDSNGDLSVVGGGETETCTGVNCSKCVFPDTGGCDCDDGGTGSCNHTISKTNQ